MRRWLDESEVGGRNEELSPIPNVKWKVLEDIWKEGVTEPSKAGTRYEADQHGEQKSETDNLAIIMALI